MAELIPQERLQPSLLDRLTDEAPGERHEPRERRVLSVERLRAGVRRDLSWLLNTVNLEAAQDLSGLPRVASSVLNYGLPDLTGRTLSGLDARGVEQVIARAIRDFEPRLLPSSLRVRLVTDPARASHNSLALEIEADLWAQPLPQHIRLETELDLEIGEFRVGAPAAVGGA